MIHKVRKGNKSLEIRIGRCLKNNTPWDVVYNESTGDLFPKGMKNNVDLYQQFSSVFKGENPEENGIFKTTRYKFIPIYKAICEDGYIAFYRDEIKASDYTPVAFAYIANETVVEGDEEKIRLLDVLLTLLTDYVNYNLFGAEVIDNRGRVIAFQYNIIGLLSLINYVGQYGLHLLNKEKDILNPTF